MRFKLLAYTLSLIPICVIAKPGYHEPWGKDSTVKMHHKKHAEPSKDKASLAVVVADQIIKFHQQVISPVDGPRSHYRPTSSRYMQLAMQRHGFIKGFIMGCDRLLRENKDPWVYRSIEIDGELFKYDPPRK
jgi:putative component of membrane protein insertase Oxa1/YidC/SpoIIIJ protein YidD